jgi:uncharacterized protein DUF4136
MNFPLNKIWSVLLIASLPVISPAQKVKIEYDKGTDFLKFKSYTWAELTTAPSRPLLYWNIVTSVDAKLKTRGLTRTESNGDLILVPEGGVGLGFNVAAGTPILSTSTGPPPALDATMWTGASGSGNLMAPYVAEGTLILTFVDRATNKVVWIGTVSQKLDIEKKNKSLELVEKSIVKLLKEFPPARK